MSSMIVLDALSLQHGGDVIHAGTNSDRLRLTPVDEL